MMDIPVTKPFLPPREEYAKLLDDIWECNWLTNNGPLVQRLEQKLKNYLGVSYLTYLTNGTIALQIAIKALNLKDEIITTPFSYVATTSSIVWENCTPVFVDIDPQTLNINPDLIEEAITEKTSGILATHVFGNPCDIDAIKRIGDQYNLKVIYDAAHCFGTQFKGQSVYRYGDISTGSFHATKLYHTIEGGAIFTENKNIFNEVYHMRNFGHAGPGNFNGVGINGKNSEFHAAMGLCVLRYIDGILDRRKEQWKKYEQLFNELEIKSITIHSEAEFNFSYYPVILESEEETLNIKDALEKKDIHPRRYFYPSLCRLEYVLSERNEISVDISKKILCLPLYHDLTENEQFKIFKVIKENLKEKIL